MNLLKKLSSFFSTDKLSHLTPVYKRTFVPDTPYSLKLWTPALIILGYNLYMNEWQAKNIGFLFVLSTMALAGSFGVGVRNNSTITSMYLNKSTNKLYINLHKPRREAQRIGEMFLDSSFDPETNTIIIPKQRLLLSKTQYSKGMLSDVKQGQFVLLLRLLKEIGGAGKSLKTKYLLHIDLDKNEVTDTEKVIDEIFENKEENEVESEEENDEGKDNDKDNEGKDQDPKDNDQGKK